MSASSRPYPLRVLRAADAARLGVTEYVALVVIAEVGDIGRLELASELGRIGPTTSRVINLLADRGFVELRMERYGPVHARRRRRIRITPAGAAIAARRPGQKGEPADDF